MIKVFSNVFTIVVLLVFGLNAQMHASISNWICAVDHYENTNWIDLPDSVKQSLGVLGWNQITWDIGGTYPPSENKSWSELSQVEQQAAGTLCYTESSWNI
jgi:hypothetical protein